MLDEAQEASGKVIVNGYRRLGTENRCAPTAKTSDQEIIEMYQVVGTAFRRIADQRGERLIAGTVNRIVWKFFQMSEMFGKELVVDHLAYEVEKYLREGLRADYQLDLAL